MTNNTLETKEFQTEIKQLLDIVINSLYTDREIFLRELISNAADAIEKVRYLQVTGAELKDQELPLEISIETNDEAHTLTISDTGIGMTKTELIENLGTIAHSGSKEFVKRLAEGERKDLNLIGQFGVGFFSAFMVAKKVEVHTSSYQLETSTQEWVSEGLGSYSISEGENKNRGTSIVLFLKEDAYEFAQADNIKRIIKQYSSFVPYAIKVNGENVNTVQALWTKNKQEITEEEYTEFYKFIANAYDEPLFRLHFSADAPLAINALLFVPKENFERFGFGRMEAGVNLYCRKVLIQEQAKDILPEWLRFLRGVVDSEELPLNISRETMQDSALIAKLNRVVTGRFIKFLNKQAEKELDKYKDFWEKFGIFIKEGVATDFTHRDELVKLLRFESSKTEDGQIISLNEYLQRMKDDQEAIYYVNGPSKAAIEAGPYLEVFRNKDIEVIYTHEPVDDYILGLLGEFEGKQLVSIDQADMNVPELQTSDAKSLPEEELKALIEWLKEVLGNRVSEVRESKRLVDSPAIALSAHGSHSMQRMMKLMNQGLDNIGSSILEINSKHEIIKRLNELRKEQDAFANLAAEQILENALIAAGLVVDSRDMVNRMYKILERALG